MQARKGFRVLLWLAGVGMLCCWQAGVVAGEVLAAPGPSQAISDANGAVEVAQGVAGVGRAAGAALAPAGADGAARAVQPVADAKAAASALPSTTDSRFGIAMSAAQLDAHRGGDALIGQNDLTGSLTNTTANRVVTGSNSISQGSFSNASGLPTVIQNSGANVLIQNATVLNVRFGD